MAYSSYFGLGASSAMPVSMEQQHSSKWVGPYRMLVSRWNLTSPAAGGAGAGFGGQAQSNFSALDEAMSGLDSRSEQYESTLRSIYDGYMGELSTYEGDIKDIIGKMDGDIDKILGTGGHLEGYQSLLDEMKPRFFEDGIKVEESDAQRRSTYMGNAVSQAASSEAAQRRQMAAQGLNPYANAGNQRALALSRNASMAGAGNQAYNDWMQAHNQQVAADQSAKATFAGLQAKVPEMYLQGAGLRGQQLGAYGNLIDTRLAAQQAKAKGYEGLLGWNEGRRTEQLELAKNQQQAATAAQTNAQQIAAANAQTTATFAQSGLGGWGVNDWKVG